MAELIYVQDNGKLAFGDYTLAAKAKADGFEFGGDLYKVKTFQEITKLERNGITANITKCLSDGMAARPCVCRLGYVDVYKTKLPRFTRLRSGAQKR